MKFAPLIRRVLKDPTLLLPPTDRRVALAFIEAMFEVIDRAIETRDMKLFDKLHAKILKLMLRHPHTEEFQVGIVDLLEYVELERDAVEMNGRHGEHLRSLENYRATIVEPEQNDAA